MKELENKIQEEQNSDLSQQLSSNYKAIFCRQ